MAPTRIRSVSPSIGVQISGGSLRVAPNTMGMARTRMRSDSPSIGLDISRASLRVAPNKTIGSPLGGSTRDPRQRVSGNKTDVSTLHPVGTHVQFSPNPTPDVTKLHRGFSTSTVPALQHKAMHIVNDVDIGCSTVRCKTNPTIIRRSAAPNENHRCDKMPSECIQQTPRKYLSARGNALSKNVRLEKSCTQVSEVPCIDEIVDAIAKTLLRPALVETLTRVQELELALDEQIKYNEIMKTAMATASISLCELQQELQQERNRNDELLDSLVIASARVQNLEDTLREERNQNERDMQKMLARVKETVIRQVFTEISTEQMSENAQDEEGRHEECTVGQHIAMDLMSRQPAEDHMSLERMILKLVSDNDDLNTFVEKLVGKNCVEGFVGNSVVHALVRDPDRSYWEKPLPGLLLPPAS